MMTLNKIPKHFRENCVFEQIDYAFADGLVYCVQGINGNGKTVLLKLIAGLLEPDEGRISFNKKDVRKGVIIETPRFWNHMSGLETLRFLAPCGRKSTRKRYWSTWRRQEQLRTRTSR